MMGKKKVLIVDDEPHILKVLEMKLKSVGFEVIFALDGVEGLEKINSQCPSLVITDVHMPRMNGIELCKACEDTRSSRNFPIIVLTAQTDPDQRKAIDNLTNVVCVEKPYSLQRLTDLINQLLDDTAREDITE